MFKRVGILGHPLRPETGEVCDQIAQTLRERNIDFWERIHWEPDEISPLIAGTDLVIAIGGDGAMLRAARLCAKAKVPVLGINTGHLGFLTETNPKTWTTSLDALLAGQYWIEERMMIRAEAWRDSVMLSSDDALNDAVIRSGSAARSVLLEAYIDKGWATTYDADGLIIATPTGSTAYALAVGGPILPPELKNILVTPVAAHLSFDRPLVLSEGSIVEVVVSPENVTDIVLNIDGETVAELQSNDTVVVRASELISRFVRLRDRNYFYRSILDRMEPRLPARRIPDTRILTLPRGNDVHSH
jgi:NAD+ kinase